MRVPGVPEEAGDDEDHEETEGGQGEDDAETRVSHRPWVVRGLGSRARPVGRPHRCYCRRCRHDVPPRTILPS